MRQLKRKLAVSQVPVIVFRAMVLLALLLAGLIIAGTVSAFARSSGSGPLFRIGNSVSGGEARGSTTENGGVNVFSGIGRLRIPLAGSSTLILSIAFPYPSGDQAFTEELAAKIGDFRTMASDYFSSLPAENLIYLDEEAAKTEILRRYNASLRLGKIEALYFNDLMIID
jgi:flagellar basal body-associated protein FliL